MHHLCCRGYILDVFFYSDNDGLAYALLVLGVDQSFSFPGIADKTGFNQYRRHLGTKQNIKRRLFDPFVFNSAVALVFQMSYHRHLHIAGQPTGFVNLGILQVSERMD